MFYFSPLCVFKCVLNFTFKGVTRASESVCCCHFLISPDERSTATQTPPSLCLGFCVSRNTLEKYAPLVFREIPHTLHLICICGFHGFFVKSVKKYASPPNRFPLFVSKNHWDGLNSQFLKLASWRILTFTFVLASREIFTTLIYYS